MNQKILVLSESEDLAAIHFGRFAKAQGYHVKHVYGEGLWNKLQPELLVGRTGVIVSNLDGYVVFNRLGAFSVEGLTQWPAKERFYVSMESSAILLAHLGRHPFVINRPKPHDLSGVGLRACEQLIQGQRLGLKIPGWMVTSDWKEAEAFIRNNPKTIYRARSQNIFDFPEASKERLPLEGDWLTAPVFLLEGRIGYPVVSTYASGRLWHYDPVRKVSVQIREEEALKAFFKECGIVFGQAAGIITPNGQEYLFYGLTGFPQLRFYEPFEKEVYGELLQSISEKEVSHVS